MFEKHTIIFPHSQPIKKVDRKGKEYYIESGSDSKTNKYWVKWLSYIEKHNLTINGTKKTNN